MTDDAAHELRAAEERRDFLEDPFALTVVDDLQGKLDTALWLARKVCDRLGDDGYGTDAVSAHTYARSLVELLDSIGATEQS